MRWHDARSALYTPDQLPWHNRWGQMPDAFRPWRRGTVEARIDVLKPYEPLSGALCKPHPALLSSERESVCLFFYALILSVCVFSKHF